MIWGENAPYFGFNTHISVSSSTISSILKAIVVSSRSSGENGSSGGDTANKIGTYSLAVLSRYHGVPFYVAAPLTTLDASLLKHGWVGSEWATNTEHQPFF